MTLIVYVDDMIITGDDAKEIIKLQEQFLTGSKMKNLRGLKYILGIKVTTSKRSMFFSQKKNVC